MKMLITYKKHLVNSKDEMSYLNHAQYMRAALVSAMLLLATMTTMAQGTPQGVRIHGNVYGGGNQADVQTNTEVNMSTGQVEGNVYGGGNLGDVGNITKNTTTYNYAWKQTDGSTANEAGNNDITVTNNNTGICTVNITGGTIGTSGTVSSEHGNVFGGGKGDDDTWWCEKGMVFATSVSITAGTVNGTVFGGGEIGRVEDDTKVVIGAPSGTTKFNITGDVFGAGKGLATHGYSALVRGNADVTVQGTAQIGGSVYGGGEIATVGRYVVVGGVPTEPDGGGKCTVTVKDDAEITGDVFGAGQGINPSTYSASGDNRSKRMMVYDSERDKDGGPYEWEFYEGYEEDYEGTKYVWEYFTQDQYVAFLETLALASDTEVSVGGTTTGKKAVVNGNVYGGSESGFLQRHTQVTILDNSEIGTTSSDTDVDGDIFGGGKGIEGYAAGGRVSGYTSVTVSGGLMHGSVYGGGENGIVKGGVNVNMTGGTVNNNVFGGGALADTNTGNGSDYIAVPGLTVGTSSVTGLSEKEYVSAGTGSAQTGITYYEYKDSKYVVKSVTPGETSVSGLYVVNYTTTSDETASAGKTYYTDTHPTTVNLLGGTIGHDAYGGGLGRLAGESTTDIEAFVYGDTKVNLNGMDISDYSSAFSSIVTAQDIDGDETDDYYMVNTTGTKGCIVNRIFGCNDLNGTPKGNVTVHVYATQNKDASKTTIGAKFNKNDYSAYTISSYADLVTLAEGLSINIDDDKATLQNGSATEEAKNTALSNIVTAVENVVADKRYDLIAVYGGGNEAAYDPTTPNSSTTTTPNGARTQVIIDGCDYTSIETVYGGGNAAPVPEANVTINAAYEIETVFGGGNGKDNKESDGSANEGADIGTKDHGSSTYGTGNANTLITGGYIHEAYGGSNERGTIMGSISLSADAGTICDMLVKKMVSAGKNADIMGDAITVLGCMPDSWVDEYYGGADNANVHGNVELTITSGNFRKVFGGNNEGGIIMGHIKVNIEETSCIPINIDELYLGGNRAPYSVYGYYVTNESTASTDGKYAFEPRTSETDEHQAVTAFNGITGLTTSSSFTKYDAQPELNIISCTRIGKVFGGGLGVPAIMYADPTVNINMIPGEHAAEIDRDGTEGADGDDTLLGEIGDVYGGGNEADVNGNTTVNIGTEQTVTLTSLTTDNTKNVQGAYITGNVYGGGKGEAKTTAGTAGEAFLCAKAMVNGNTGTEVNIGNGYVGGNVYGGGEVGRVENNTVVTIGLAEDDIPEDGTSAPIINGNVFGAGKGVNTHGYSALVRGTSTVIVQADAKVRGSVYGGGEIASVGKYKVVDGLPQVLDNSQNSKSGYCYVTITDNAEIGPDDMIMTKSGGPDDAGHVFGAGKGVLPFEGYADNVAPSHMNGSKNSDDSWTDVPTSYNAFNTYNADTELQETYVKFIKSLALATATEVTIDGNAFVKGSVYGGSENGFVQKDTKVTIQGDCQIGNGYDTATNTGVNRRYNTTEWAYDGSDAAHSLAECAHWDYDPDDLAPYDPYATYQNNGEGGDGKYYYDSGHTKSAQGGAPVGTNGQTFYGNVFGGGSGYYPYKPGRWFEDAGAVYGNTVVEIKGGHILTNVYGGNELTNVGKYTASTTLTTGTGQSTISMSAGTVGVPRTAAQIAAHPVTCNVFGAGKGDSRSFYDPWTKVGNTVVTISGTARIYGSVYGGGEASDVLTTTSVSMSGGTVKRNVFGGGQGIANSFECAKAMVGVVNQGVTGTGTTADPYVLQDGGTTVDISNGTVEGNVYGGGEIARVENNTVVTIGSGNGAETGSTPTSAPVIKGSVFAAGAGLETHGYSALVRGISTVTVEGDAQVWKNVYGGGEKASVGRYKVKTPANASDSDVPSTLPYGMPARLLAGGKNTVTIQGKATIGHDDIDDSGHVFGAGKGVEPRQDYTYQSDATKPKRMVSGNTWEYFATKAAYLQFVETLALSAETDVTITGGTTVKGSVFGGSESGFVYHDTDVEIQNGTVKGDAFGGGRGLESFAEAGRVRGNTELTVSGGAAIEGNVYGGGSLGDVGTIDKTEEKDGQLTYNYYWKNSDANGNNLDSGNSNTAENNKITGTNKNTGICTVNISGGTIGLASTNEPAKHGNVFGAGKGLANTFWCEKAIAFATNVSISGSSTTVNGNVYGGGEVGRIEDDVKVMVGTASESDDPTITGSVFGGGAGVETHGYSALVRGNTTVNVEGQAKVGHSVYGGGEIASVGKYGLDEQKMPSILKGGGYCYVTVQGKATIADDVFGAGEGVKSHFDNNNSDRSKRSRRMTVYSNSTDFPEADKYTANAESYTWEYYESYPNNYQGPKFVWDYLQTPESYSTYLETLALATHPEVTIDGRASIGGSVFGGGELGLTKGSVIVNIQGGTIAEDVYGGGSLANTNTTTKADLNNDGTLEDYTPTTTVKLKSGTINRNVYGGGLGQLAKDAVDEVLYTAEDAEVIAGTKQAGDVKTPGVAAQSDIPAKVYGTVTVELNKPVTTTTGEGESATTTTTYGDCVVKGNIFGCNNQNGSPQSAVTVHIYKTQGWDGHTGTASGDLANEDATHTYHLAAVYGGGNLSAFKPDLKSVRDTVQTHVIIDGCDMTSIQHVYGGGNAASTPATNIIVNGTYEIEEVFGGGNGKDAITVNGVTQTNPGANVGYVAYSTEYDPPASSKEERTSKFAYGTGKASVTILGGRIHRVFGGSNTKGNVRESAVTMLQDMEGCYFVIDEAYGGGKSAPMDADAQLLMACIPGLKAAYGGAEDADIAGGVTLTITNGTFDRVFGGNNKSGSISGPIVVNIEEMGCRPIIIGELYGGGNQAGYSVYGYDNRIPRESGTNPLWADPVVNVKSFTSIGDIYGGGYGETAVMVASPTVNINVAEGRWADDDQSVYSGEMKTIDGHRVTLPPHEKGEGKIGVIQNVYGGGNAAKVIGTPNVNIGTRMGEDEYMAVVVEEGETLTDCYTFTKASGTAVAGTTYYQKDDGGAYRQVTVGEGASVEDYYIRVEFSGTPVAGTTYYKKYTVKGADIRGNVYGGGNAAEVTGNTNVVIGKETATP